MVIVRSSAGLMVVGSLDGEGLAKDKGPEIGRPGRVRSQHYIVFFDVGQLVGSDRLNRKASTHHAES